MEYFKQSLRELQIGVILFGILNILIGMWFPKEMLPYVLGGILGTLTALVMTDSMARSINKAVANEAKSVGILKFGAILRFTIAAVVLVVAFMSPWVNGIATFIGIFVLKLATYTAPLIHKINLKVNPNALETDGSEDMEEVQDESTVDAGEC